MLRLGRQMPLTTICLAGGLWAAMSLLLSADDAPTSSAKDSPKGEAATAEKPDASESEAEKKAAPTEKYRLAFKFQPDQVVRYSVESEMEMTTHLSGTTEIARNKSESKRSYKVLQVTPENEAELQLSIDWVHMVAWFDDGVRQTKPVEFQSDDPTKHPRQFEHIRATVGTPQATIRFSALGRPLNVQALNRAGGANAAAGPANPVGNKAKNGAAAVAAADASHENYLVPLPSEPVAVGDTWRERYDITARDNDLPVRITVQRKYTLREVQDGLATIEFQTTILTPVQKPAIEAQLIQRETSGKFVFDIEKGLIVSRESKCDKLVQDAIGDKSSTKAVSHYQEKLISVTTTAEREAPAATATSKQ